MKKASLYYIRKLFCKAQFLLGDNVDRLQAAVAAFGIKRYVLALVQGLITIRLDRGEVYEHILAVFHRDKAITFFCVKPFYRSVIH